MSATLPAGPYRSVTLNNGDSVPFYVIPFDKRGVCEAPQTRADLVRQAKEAKYSDVFLFSHGWNNDWTVATKRYEDFLRGFMNMRRQFDLPSPGGYRPLLVGVFWPSTALTFGEAEEGPQMAGAADESAIARERHDLSELGSALTPGQAARFFELAQRQSVSEKEAQELVEMFAGLTTTIGDEISDSAPTAKEVVESCLASTADDFSDFGTANGSGGQQAQTAGVIDALKTLDPRDLIRMFTVWQMKDRAGTVGARGVGPLLRELLAGSSARVHLIGHSFGAKVMMSALCNEKPPRNVSSALLLQPAMSHLCFAASVPESNKPGGYRPALEWIEGRILTTFSSHDQPLTKFFHLALRRERDLGEAVIAAAEPPSRYAALGGFGPRGAGEKFFDIKDPAARYDWPQGTKLVALRGDRTISGHGDISNASTWWALYCGAFQQ